MRRRAPAAATTAGRWAALTAGAALSAQYVPSTVALGQWAPWAALPGGLCRWRGPAERAAMALTFDDGPHPEATPAVLDRLEALGLRATFFMLGTEVERYPDLVHEVARRGHLVASHGHRHRHHLTRPPRWVAADLARAADRLAGLGFWPRWYRPSYGQATGATLWLARRRGWQSVLWSAWGREWATDDPAAVVQRIGRRLRPGAIVLLHDSDRYGTPGMWRLGLEALGPVAELADRRGLQAMTLDELNP